ncbi:MAG TPA: GGDEF domain-containing protein [Candidatus Sulfotelmatobacter sp.]|jgi:diguanylate cyclase (GGDEF)-like protein|nr:GGDEF domain-containing protein [Candidatus Sulfotelmatobacter sp.]
MQKLVESVMDPRLASLLSLWRGVYPKTGEITDPLALFAELSPHLVIIGCEHIYSQYLHYGSALTDRFGLDLTGKIIELLPPDILPPQQRGMLEFEYGYARTQDCVLWRSYTASFPGDKTETWQRLVLPLGHNRLAVAALPGAVSADHSDTSSGKGLLRLLIDRVPVVLDAKGHVQDLALSLKFFSSTQQHLTELEALASLDGLTGVPNRRHFHHLAGLELDHARLMGRSFSVLALDIDHFKAINDGHGHAMGDEALKAFSAACRAGLREPDVLGRCGGEEFAIALPNTGTEAACLIAERLRRQVSDLRLPLTDGSDLSFTVSIGIATLTPGEGGDDISLTALLAHADAALYRAKREGRNRACVVNQEDLRLFLDRQSLPS